MGKTELFQTRYDPEQMEVLNNIQQMRSRPMPESDRLDGSITPHFRWAEARCPDGCELSPDIQTHILAMARVMEVVREIFGRPIIVNSWYRCWKHHAAIYARSNKEPPKGSLHLQGLGVDFKVSGVSPADAFEKCKELQTRGIVGGIERAPGHVHVDVGPTRTFEGPSL